MTSGAVGCPLCSAVVGVGALDHHLRRELNYAAWECRLCPVRFFSFLDAAAHFDPAIGPHAPAPLQLYERLDRALEIRLREILVACGQAPALPPPDEVAKPQLTAITLSVDRPPKELERSLNRTINPSLNRTLSNGSLNRTLSSGSLNRTLNRTRAAPEPSDPAEAPSEPEEPLFALPFAPKARAPLKAKAQPSSSPEPDEPVPPKAASPFKGFGFDPDDPAHNLDAVAPEFDVAIPQFGDVTFGDATFATPAPKSPPKKVVRRRGPNKKKAVEAAKKEPAKRGRKAGAAGKAPVPPPRRGGRRPKAEEIEVVGTAKPKRARPPPDPPKKCAKCSVSVGPKPAALQEHVVTEHLKKTLTFSCRRCRYTVNGDWSTARITGHLRTVHRYTVQRGKDDTAYADHRKALGPEVDRKVRQLFPDDGPRGRPSMPTPSRVPATPRASAPRGVLPRASPAVGGRQPVARSAQGPVRGLPPRGAGRGAASPDDIQVCFQYEETGRRGPPQRGAPVRGPPQRGPPPRGAPPRGPVQRGTMGPPSRGPPLRGPPQRGSGGPQLYPPPQRGGPQRGAMGPPPSRGAMGPPPARGPPPPARPAPPAQRSYMQTPQRAGPPPPMRTPQRSDLPPPDAPLRTRKPLPGLPRLPPMAARR